jgi:hypothetical protein
LAAGSATSPLARADPRQSADRCDRKLTIAEILRGGAAVFVQSYSNQAPPQTQSTLAKLSLCRTAALGGRHYRCGQCAHECVVYNSCGDRHCPTCSGAKRADWLDSSSELLLDGVPYFQVVFTLPKDLSRLALGNRRAIFDLLFRSSWRSLQTTIHSEQGYDAAALMVLHTWDQKLDAHIHVHAIVPGGGPALDGSGWRWSRRGSLDEAIESGPIGRYLVDADDLRAAYREQFLRGLDRLWKRGELKLEGEFAHLRDEAAWRTWLDALRSIHWVSYIEPPPSEHCQPQHVMKYLARYLTGGPISDRRIVRADNREVTFKARAGTTVGGDRQQIEITLPTTEFVRRWSLHILPRGYTKTRRYGCWSNPRRETFLKLCREQLKASREFLLTPNATDIESSDAPETNIPADEIDQCPQCGNRMILQAAQEKPSWRHIMESPNRPAWYRMLVGR